MMLFCLLYKKNCIADVYFYSNQFDNTSAFQSILREVIKVNKLIHNNAQQR